MKVLFVDQFGKTTGRDTLALAELVNVDQNIDMTVYLSDNTEIPTDRKYTVKIKKGFSGAYEGNFLHKVVCYLKALRELKKFIIKNKIDIVHLQWFSIPWVEWLYLDELSKLCKIVITVHDVIPFDKRPFEMSALDRIYDRANALCIHTNTAKELFSKCYNTKTPVSVITQGFCIKSDYHIIDKIIAKKHFNIPEDAIVFLYYGTIRQSKGLDILIKAIHKAHQNNKHVFLLAAGAFHKVNEEYYRNLVSKLIPNDVGNIAFGFVPQDEEQWYFSAADVLCLPYLEVTQSGVAQLGLMYDLPIIATDIGEMRDVVRDDVNGLIINANDEAALKGAILSLASSDNKRKCYSKGSKLLGEKEFTLNNKAERIIAVYKSLYK